MAISDLSFFHNQKDGSFDPESGVTLKPGDKKFDDYQKLLEKEGRDKKIGETSKIEDHLISLIAAINNINLISSQRTNKKQLMQLEVKKQQAKELILDTLYKVEEYIGIIKELEEIKIHKDNQDQKIYREKLENMDLRRELKHNALMSSINIANRFIANNFGIINEERLEEWLDTEEQANRPILDIKRVELPPNIICVDTINLSDRHQVTEWAIQLSNSLAKLKKELSD
ncbi:DUF3232 domain-containing protein [Patescibacteria group bacterium]